MSQIENITLLVNLMFFIMVLKVFLGVAFALYGILNWEGLSEVICPNLQFLKYNNFFRWSFF